MATSIVRGVQPLQYRGLPMWHYNGEDDASRCGRKGPDTPAALAKILAKLYKGEKEEFTHIKRRDGFFMYNPSYNRQARHAPPTNAIPGDPRPRACLSPTSRYRCSLSAGCGKVVRVFCSSALHHGHPIVALMATAADFVSGLLILTMF